MGTLYLKKNMCNGKKPEHKSINDEFAKDGLENGPVGKRSATDVICWLIWVSAFCFWLVTIFYGVSKGDPTQVFAPWDENGRQCGYTAAVKDYKYAYFYTALSVPSVTDLRTKIVCVDKCPSYDTDPSFTVSSGTYSISLTTLGTQSIGCVDTTNSATVSSLPIPNGSAGCTNFYGYKAYSFLGVYCLPNITWINSAATALASVSTNFNNTFEALGYLRKWVNDIGQCWYIILAGFCIAIFFGLLYCYFLRCCAGFVTWIMLLGLMISLWLGGWLAYDSGEKYQADIDAANAAAALAGTTADTSDDEWNRNWMYVFAGIIWFFALIFTCVVCYNFQRIRLIIGVIKASARFINDNMLMLLVPVYNVLVTLALLACWICGVIYLYSVGTVSQNTTYPWSNVAWEQFTEGAFYFNLFFGLWLVAFMVSFNVFWISSSAVIWFFQQGEGQEEGSKSRKNPCCTGWCWAAWYHMGSIAFGSFILAVIWAIQIIMAYIDRKMKDAQAKNKCIELVFKYVHCCLACFEKCIQFLNKQAYIQVALTNKNFCSSAWKAFTVVLSHMVDFSMLALIGNFFMYIAIILISFGTAAICWLVLTQANLFSSLSSIWFPIILCGVEGFVIAKIFTSIYLVACYAI